MSGPPNRPPARKLTEPDPPYPISLPGTCKGSGEPSIELPTGSTLSNETPPAEWATQRGVVCGGQGPLQVPAPKGSFQRGVLISAGRTGRLAGGVRKGPKIPMAGVERCRRPRPGRDRFGVKWRFGQAWALASSRGSPTGGSHRERKLPSWKTGESLTGRLRQLSPSRLAGSICMAAEFAITLLGIRFGDLD